MRVVPISKGSAIINGANSAPAAVTGPPGAGGEVEADLVLVRPGEGARWMDFDSDEVPCCWWCDNVDPEVMGRYVCSKAAREIHAFRVRLNVLIAATMQAKR